MKITLTVAQINLLLEALNSHEGVLATEWEQARAKQSSAKQASLSEEMQQVRDLSYLLAGFKATGA